VRVAMVRVALVKVAFLENKGKARISEIQTITVTKVYLGNTIKPKINLVPV